MQKLQLKGVSFNMPRKPLQGRDIVKLKIKLKFLVLINLKMAATPYKNREKEKI